MPETTRVYPVHTRWSMRTYSSSGVIMVEQDGVHNFYVNAFGKWQCGMASSREVKPMQFIGTQLPK